MKNDPLIVGRSWNAVQGRARRKRLRASTNGHCFYCGGYTYAPGHPDPRDWLFLSQRFMMVAEHVLPTSRGGTDDPSNRVAACSGCNYDKGPFALDEFRLLRGLQRGDLNFRFAFEPVPSVTRDWLCCHSPSAEKALMIHNMPSAADAYDLRRRDPDGPLHEPRVRPLSS